MDNIHIEELDWQSQQDLIRNIRTRVFVEEQGVPAGEEWDEEDNADHTEHFGVLNDKKLIAYVRLVQPQPGTYKVTRLVVEKTSRHRGFGTALVKKACIHALNRGCDILYLHAQINAMPLYEALGFRATSEPFYEAGIAHQAMNFDLFLPLGYERIFSNRVIRLTCPSDSVPHAVNILRGSSRSITICSHQLRDDIFAKDRFLQALSEFARRDRRAKVKILVHSSKNLSRRAQSLIELSRRLSSKISIKTLTSGTEELPNSFISGDNKRLIYFNDETKAEGFCCYHAGAESESLYERFDHAWNHQSKVDPDLKQLSI